MNSKKIEEQRFEFALKINGHIICQRYFHINNFNEDSIYSTEIKSLMDNLVGVNLKSGTSLGIIPTHLKKKSMEFLWGNFDPYFEQTQEMVNVGRNNYDKEDVFDFEIKVDKKVVAESRVPGNIFPHKVRYQVDIKEIIPVITSEIRYYLSLKNYTHEFAGMAL